MPSTKATAKAAPPETVDAYMAELPPEQRAVLEELRRVILAAAPGGVEVISYGMPAVKHRKARVYYAAWKGHYSIYGLTTAALDAHREEVEPYLTEKGMVKLSYSEQVPAALVTKLVKAQVTASEKTAKK
jgi:uncharacterized protein YdhG (YjbR/CyaY superfamily)